MTPFGLAIEVASLVYSGRWDDHFCGPSGESSEDPLLHHLADDFAILWDRVCGHILRIYGLNFGTDFDPLYLSTKVPYLALPREVSRDDCEEGPDMRLN